ncbi:MAG TPA: hypothetical protein VI299_25400, partial [Polyangiales bacterium]
MSLAGWARSLRELFVGDRPRSMTLVGDRAYVEFRGVSREDLARFGEQLRERVRAHDNIRSVHVNGLMRRVAFQFNGTLSGRTLLEALVSDAERAVGAAPYSQPADSERQLPDDLTLDREYSVEAMVDAFAVVWGMSLRLLPFVPRRLGSNVYGALLMIQQVPSLRRPLDERLG